MEWKGREGKWRGRGRGRWRGKWRGRWRGNGEGDEMEMEMEKEKERERERRIRREGGRINIFSLYLELPLKYCKTNRCNLFMSINNLNRM
jgi:hypothetical protein